MQARTVKPAAARAISIVRRPMETRIVPVILAGGSGTRLWPVSRDSLPKQFQRLIGDLSTYQQTLERVADRARFADPIVVTNDESRFFAQRQAMEVGTTATLLIEPERRDSAAALPGHTRLVD